MRRAPLPAREAQRPRKENKQNKQKQAKQAKQAVNVNVNVNANVNANVNVNADVNVSVNVSKERGVLCVRPFSEGRWSAPVSQADSPTIKISDLTVSKRE